MQTEIINLLETTYTSFLSVAMPIAVAYIISVVKKLNTNKLSTQMDENTKKINEISEKLEKHIADSDERDIRNRRKLILDYCNSIMNGKRHTKEEFDFIITQCDSYEQYCFDEHIRNGVADNAIAEIKRVYKKCTEKNSFLKEGEEDEQ